MTPQTAVIARSGATKQSRREEREGELSVWFRPLAAGGSAISLADGVGDTFGSHFRRVLAIRWYLAMIAGLECCFRRAVSAHRDFAAENHDPHVKVVRMHILGKAGGLAAMNDLKALAA